MNMKFTVYITKEDQIKEINDKAIKLRNRKIIYTFFSVCLTWFGYTIFKILTI